MEPLGIERCIFETSSPDCCKRLWHNPRTSRSVGFFLTRQKFDTARAREQDRKCEASNGHEIAVKPARMATSLAAPATSAPAPKPQRAGYRKAAILLASVGDEASAAIL